MAKRSSQRICSFEGLNELLRATVGLWLVVVGRGAGDAEVVDLDLVVLGAKSRTAVVAQRQSCGDGGVDGAEALGRDLPEQIGGAKRSIRSPASAYASPEAWAIITNTAQRPSSVQPSIASVAHSVSGTVTVIVARHHGAGGPIPCDGPHQRTGWWPARHGSRPVTHDRSSLRPGLDTAEAAPRCPAGVAPRTPPSTTRLPPGTPRAGVRTATRSLCAPRRPRGARSCPAGP